MMPNIYIKIILACVKSKKSISQLINAGFTYGQIATLISDLQTEGLIKESVDGKLILSDLGIYKLAELSKMETDKSKWILTSEKNKIKKIKMDDLYIPKNYPFSKP